MRNTSSNPSIFNAPTEYSESYWIPVDYTGDEVAEVVLGLNTEPMGMSFTDPSGARLVSIVEIDLMVTRYLFNHLRGIHSQHVENHQVILDKLRGQANFDTPMFESLVSDMYNILMRSDVMLKDIESHPNLTAMFCSLGGDDDMSVDTQ